MTATAALVLATFAGSAPPLVQPTPNLLRGGWLNGAEIVPGQVIVRYKVGTTAAERRDAVLDQRAAVAESLGLPRTDLVELPEGTSVEQAIAAFESDPDVAYAEPDYVSHVNAIPNDTNFGQLWGLNQPSDKDIDAPEAWDLTTGSSSIIVAVIDSGVAYDHPDLAQNIWTNPGEIAGNGLDDDANGFVDDTRGWDFVGNDNTPLDSNEHGTHVAGTIGAHGNNNLGVTGVNWQVSIMPVRAGDASGGLTDSAIISAIQYACANGARVVNGSFGGGGFSSSTLAAITSATCANTLFVFAAGNGGDDGVGDNNDTTPTYPCNYNTTRIVCVAATTATDTRASFSNFGVTNVDLAAPGVGTLSTKPSFVTVLSDGFENSPSSFSSRWGAQAAPAGHPTWGQQAPGLSGSFLLSDSASGNYSANTDTTIRSLNPMNLSGLAGCSLSYAVNLNMKPGDFFTIEAAPSDVGPWTNVRQDPFNGEDGPTDFFAEAGDAGVIDGKSTAYLRFRITSNGSVQSNGARVDELTFACAATPSAIGDYQLLSGTSMATPHVAGAAALVLARNPALTAAQVRSILLTTVDPVAGLSVASGGRLNLRSAVAAAQPDTIPPPVPTIDSGPTGTVASTTATFAFSDTEGGVTFECRVDAASFAPCISPKQFTSLAQGAHTFQARAKDPVGNTSAAASRPWIVDTVAPPVPTIDSGPTGTVASTSASFAFSDTEGGATFECKLDDAASFAPCTSPTPYTSLAQGTHSFQVQAKDAAGNTSSATRAWSVDTVAPPVPAISSGPAGLTASTAASFTFSSNEGGVSFQCRRDGAPFAPCASPVSFASLTQGAHTFQARVRDAVGNTSPAASRAWTVDTAKPNTMITSGPANTTTSRTATFRFKFAEAGSTFRCRLDGGAFKPCSSGKTYRSLTKSFHTFRVRATDPAGNTDATPAKRTWTIR